MPNRRELRSVLSLQPRFEIFRTGVVDHLTCPLWRRSANLAPQWAVATPLDY